VLNVVTTYLITPETLPVAVSPPASIVPAMAVAVAKVLPWMSGTNGRKRPINCRHTKTHSRWQHPSSVT